ncbi:L-2-amino-thiazoline-4-carboxylic acid hydrolase [Dysosmobacter sp.]|uniref:L-2-amino-thiazoline-4-carboxylic acid hydrolase n=1 Tax=Dysosmobacter sp. TaxID=2591382 RepID=UPI002A850FEE|nr:L-2-amino-thiazoline-4-carboxylic acid hydrolase [Dysosmobacter sp.]MDY3282519.1 L-2-amino-thiazoline-4-carboxylic acid hydrolase [Dysosmobacter sp.]
MEKENMDVQQAKNDVLIMADRLSSLYYFMVKSILQENDEETTERIVRRAIEEYGLDCGRRARKKVTELGEPITLQNYRLGKDLPSVGWEKKKIDTGSENVKASEVSYCPFAQHWKELGFEKWGRMYCYVDQAKYRGYCDGMTCYHDKNLLDGDDCCIVRIVTEPSAEEEK